MRHSPACVPVRRDGFTVPRRSARPRPTCYAPHRERLAGHRSASERRRSLVLLKDRPHRCQIHNRQVRQHTLPRFDGWAPESALTGQDGQPRSARPNGPKKPRFLICPRQGRSRAHPLAHAPYVSPEHRRAERSGGYRSCRCLSERARPSDSARQGCARARPKRARGWITLSDGRDDRFLSAHGAAGRSRESRVPREAVRGG